MRKCANLYHIYDFAFEHAPQISFSFSTVHSQLGFVTLSTVHVSPEILLPEPQLALSQLLSQAKITDFQPKIVILK
jgi:hypothetical protein